jgi:hypothetical protein
MYTTPFVALLQAISIRATMVWTASHFCVRMQGEDVYVRCMLAAPDNLSNPTTSKTADIVNMEKAATQHNHNQAINTSNPPTHF